MQDIPKRRVKATITAILTNGLCVDVEGERGFVRRRDISWEDPSTIPGALHALGSPVDAVVLGRNPDHGNQLILSIKHAVRDPWEEFLPRYKHHKNRGLSLLLEGTVTEIFDNRAYIEMPDKTTAVLYRRDLKSLEYFAERSLADLFKLGDCVRGVAADIEEANERIVLSIEGYLDIVRSDSHATYKPVTLADIFGDKMLARFGPTAAEAEDDELSTAADEAIDGLMPDNGRNWKALIIDDRRKDAEEVQATLRRIRIAADIKPYECEASLPSSDVLLDYGAVFIDKNLRARDSNEVIDGCVVARAILQASGAIPLVIITAESEAGALERLRQAGIHELVFFLTKPLNRPERIREAVEWARCPKEQRTQLLRERNLRLEFSTPWTTDSAHVAKIASVVQSLCEDQNRLAFLLEYNSISQEIGLVKACNFDCKGWAEYKSTLRHTPLIDVMSGRQIGVLYPVPDRRKKHLPPELRDIVSLAGYPVAVCGEVKYGIFLADSRKSLSLPDYRMLIEAGERIAVILERKMLNEEIALEQRYRTTGMLYESMRHDIVGILDSLRSLDLVKLWDKKKSLLVGAGMEAEQVRTEFREVLAATNKAGKDVAELFEFFSSIERRGLEDKEVNLQEAIRGLVDMIRTKEGVAGVEISFESRAPANLLICTSLVKLNQILRNMIFNACQQILQFQMPVRRVVVGLDFQEEVRDLPVHITVRDTGPGIHHVDYDRIFMPLYSTRKDGMGFGLSICRQLALELGGRVEIRSSYMLTGSEFLLSLPLER